MKRALLVAMATVVTATVAVAQQADESATCELLIGAALGAESWPNEVIARDCLQRIGPQRLVQLVIAAARWDSELVDVDLDSRSGPTGPVGASQLGIGAMQVVDMRAHFSERNAVWWRWVYRVELLNRGDRRLDLGKVCVRAADADGETVDDVAHFGVSFEAGESRAIGGYLLIATADALQVRKMGVRLTLNWLNDGSSRC